MMMQNRLRHQGPFAHDPGWRNMLNVSGFHGSALPRIQDLSDSIGIKPVPRGDLAGVPPQHKVELGELSLQVGPVMFWKRWNLGRKADPVRADGLAQIADAYLL